MIDQNKLELPLMVAFKQTKDLLSTQVRICNRNDLRTARIALVVLKKKFEAKGINNDTTKLVVTGIENLHSVEAYISMMQDTLKRFIDANTNYVDSMNAMRLENQKLLIENETLKY